MSEKWNKYIDRKKLAFHDGVRKAKQMKFCYAFLAPFAILFITFTILPIINSIYYSFTNLIFLKNLILSESETISIFSFRMK